MNSLAVRFDLHSEIYIASFNDTEKTIRISRRRKLFESYTTVVEFYAEEVLWGFLPCGFPEENICVLVFLCFCACCSFSDLLVANCFKNLI